MTTTAPSLTVQAHSTALANSLRWRPVPGAPWQPHRLGLGGWPLFAITTDGSALCSSCVLSERDQVLASDGSDGWALAAVGRNHKDPGLHCDRCGTRIESAHAEEEAELLAQERWREVTGQTPFADDPLPCSVSTASPTAPTATPAR